MMYICTCIYHVHALYMYKSYTCTYNDIHVHIMYVYIIVQVYVQMYSVGIDTKWAFLIHSHDSSHTYAHTYIHVSDNLSLKLVFTQKQQ